MYGLINLAIEVAIKKGFGDDFWELIKDCCRDSIGDTDGTFLQRLYYDDEVTYRLLDKAERILHSEKYGHVSQLSGEKFYELIIENGYEGILKLLGGSFKDFLDNLDSFHAHLSSTYSRMQPPSFRCSFKYDSSGEKEADRLILHYYSERIGLEGIVMGMVRAVARELHKIRIDISIGKLKLVDQGIDHTEFIIHLLGPTQQSNAKQQMCVDENLLNVSGKVSSQQEHSNSQFPLYEDEENFNYKQVKQLNLNPQLSKVSPLVFAQALPFHLIFDRNLIIKQAGTSILRVIPILNTKQNVKLTSVLKMLEPKCLINKNGGNLDFNSILKYINSVYVFRPDERQVISGGHRHLHCDYLKSLKANNFNRELVSGEEVAQVLSDETGKFAANLNEELGEEERKRRESDELIKCQLPEADIDKYIVKLRGQMTYMMDNDLMLFVCSPSVANLDDLNNTGLFLSDIPLHDATRDLVLLSEQFEAEYKVQEKLKKLTEQLNVMKNDLEEEKKKTDRLLYSVLPPLVANELRNNRPVPAKRFQPVTILFSGIVGFSDFCAKNSDSSGAIRIVNLLNKIYTTFDVLTEPKRNPYVYKVETVGDKYMAVSGLPEACDSHARHINRLALDIYDLAKTIKLEEYTGPVYQQQHHGSRPKEEVAPAPEFTQMDQCEHLRVTIGIHCGEVVTGVIGKRTPRYCLFGNTVNLTSRCETTGKKGSINVSQDVYNLCTKDPNNFDPEFNFQYRGQINMKGKSEPMGMWYLTRRRHLFPPSRHD